MIYVCVPSPAGTTVISIVSHNIYIYGTQGNHSSFLHESRNPGTRSRKSASLSLPANVLSLFRNSLALQEQQQRDFGVEGSRYQSQRSQKLEHRRHRSNEHRESQKEARHYGSLGEEREGETSGYASDSVDVSQAGQSESSLNYERISR